MGEDARPPFATVLERSSRREDLVSCPVRGPHLAAKVWARATLPFGQKGMLWLAWPRPRLGGTRWARPRGFPGPCEGQPALQWIPWNSMPLLVLGGGPVPLATTIRT